MTSRVVLKFYKDARDRMQSITSDPAVLDGFERLVQNGDVDEPFLRAVFEAGISFNYMFFGVGEPFMSNARLIGRVVAV